MKASFFYQCMSAISGLIEGAKFADAGSYKVLWLKDHFKVIHTERADKDAHLIIRLFAVDINAGLKSSQWNTIAARVRALGEEGVIK